MLPSPLDRRAFLGSAAAGALAVTAGRGVLPAAPRPIDPFFDDLQQRTFNYFWETTNPANGLAPDRYPRPPYASIASVGFALTAYPIGVERRWITRAQARERVLATLRFLNDAPQGPQPHGVTGNMGFFYHYLDTVTGLRVDGCELSTVDTALLLGGVLFCQSWFNGPHADEIEIRRLAEAIYLRVDWRWAQQPGDRSPAINLGWLPDRGFIRYSWFGYNEAMLLYLLALGSPTHAVEPDAWAAWQRNFDKTWGLNFGTQPHLGFAPLFGHQYSHVWVDFRGVRDAYMRGRDLDYFENSRRATYAQRAYAIANPLGWKGYGEDLWGITACDGPGDLSHLYGGKILRFHSYWPRGAGTRDDGTLAPTAVLGSIAFAPEICVPAALRINHDYGQYLLGPYGFLDAFNPSFDFPDLQPKYGRSVPGVGWFGTDYLGIDQGPILAMIENWRSGLIWKTMRANPHIVAGLQRAGFTGGWLGAA